MSDNDLAALVLRLAHARYDDDTAGEIVGFWWSIYLRERDRRPHDPVGASKIAYRRAKSRVLRDGERFSSPRPRTNPRLASEGAYIDVYGDVRDVSVPGYVDADPSYGDGLYRAIVDHQSGLWTRTALDAVTPLDAL